MSVTGKLLGWVSPYRLIWLAASLIFVVSAQQVGGRSAAQDKDANADEADDHIVLSAEQVALARKEIARQQHLFKNKGKFENSREYQLALAGPIIEGNYKDYQHNRLQTATASAKARDLKSTGDDKKAAGYQMVASMYKEVAVCNYSIYMAYHNNKGLEKVPEYMRQIASVEKRFAELTHHEMKRTWLTFDELDQYRSKLLNVRKKQVKNARRATQADQNSR